MKIDIPDIRTGFWFAVGFFLFGLLVTLILRAAGAVKRG